MLFSFVINFC